LSSSLIIGVDGGGTKTVAWLARWDDIASVVLGRGHAGPGNPRAAGFDTALANIDAAIKAAFVDARLDRITVSAACFCLAGAGREQEQQRITAWAKDLKIADVVSVRGDAEPILAAASRDHTGIALICGTGSLAWGRNAKGEVGRTGGWGYLLGDEGSAYAIARAALTTAVKAADGRGAATVLLDQILRELKAADTAELVERVYAPEMTRERLAGLASVVFAAAASDAVAKAIIETAASDLAEMVDTLRRRLGFQPKGYSLALAGSVILHQPLLRSLLEERLADRDCTPQIIHSVDEPVAGAIALARRLLE
jgi:N-acetylglucosamine kinase-like BadF-type ATPase